MGKLLLGIVIGVLAVPVFAYLYLRLGLFPAETSAPPFPFGKELVAMGLRARIGIANEEKPRTAATDADYMEGAKVYREVCVICHGLSGDQTATAKGMYPQIGRASCRKGV